MDALEIALLQTLTAQFGRVSVERLLSGAGLLNIYRALGQLEDQPATLETPAAITDAARAGDDALAVTTLDVFCRVLGSTAGNLALTLGARGGVYLAGGILPQLADSVKTSALRQRFEAKGRFQGYLAAIPVRLVTRDDLGLLGAARKLQLDPPPGE